MWPDKRECRAPTHLFSLRTYRDLIDLRAATGDEVAAGRPEGLRRGDKGAWQGRRMRFKRAIRPYLCLPYFASLKS